MSGEVSPKYLAGMGVLSYFTPAALILLTFFLIYHSIRRNWWQACLALLILLTAFSSIRASFAWNFLPHSDHETAPLKVLSYNVRVFNLYQTYHNKSQLTQSGRFIKWLAEEDADVKCVQEFHHQAQSSVFNTLSHIGGKKGYQHQISYEDGLKKSPQYFGVAIFSRLPVLESGDFPLNIHWTKRGVYMDILFQKDTIRVVNVHMLSLSLDENRIFAASRSLSQRLDTYLDLYHTLEDGFVKRNQQLSFLLRFLKKSPYPIILCGDFNSTPYTYVYKKLNRDFENAFVQAGWGFGFSYRGRIPFLRIDHQFHSPT
ncbi:MAG: endonuclease/exonuclease/phosphatase family protein, partial [Bacteroidota bacterium]